MNIERKIIHLLKLKGPLSTNQIAQSLNISKTCAYSHIATLESKQFLERKLIKTKVGRPGYKYILTENGVDAFNHDGYFMGDFLHFIVKSNRGEIISSFLKSMYSEIARRYEGSLLPGAITSRAEQLVTLRTNDGYMASLIRQAGETLSIEQANCPILKMARIDGSACELERDMFSDLLGTEIEITQKQMCGTGVCRFHIKSE